MIAQIPHARLATCTDKAGSVLFSLSGRTRSSGARGSADLWQICQRLSTGWLSRPCQAEAYGIESVGETVIPTRLVKATRLRGLQDPLRPARLFFGLKRRRCS